MTLYPGGVGAHSGERANENVYAYSRKYGFPTETNINLAQVFDDFVVSSLDHSTYIFVSYLEYFVCSSRLSGSGRFLHMAEENTKTVDINLMIMPYCDKKKIIDNGAIKGNESHAILSN